MKRIERIPLSRIKRMEVYINADKKPIREIKAEKGADYALNLVYFTGEWKATCQLKGDGTVHAYSTDIYHGFAWNTGGDIQLVPLPTRGDKFASYFACMCAVKDGKPTYKLFYNKDVGGKRGRTAIGLTTGSELLLYASKDGVDASTPEGLQAELAALGDVESAVIVDGGTKSNLLGPNGNVEGAVNKVQNLLLIYLKEEEPPMGAKVYSNSKDGKTKLSDNFRVSEFACKDGSDGVVVSPDLVTLLQKIRDHFGKPVVINSAYRTVSYNTKVGGSPKSQHLYGTAADIVVTGVTPLEVAQYVEYLLPKSGGIGVYQTFTHVDVRTSRARWDNRSGREVAVTGWPGYVPPVAEKTEAEAAVEWATANGILLGNTDGDLMLDQPVTRKQQCVMLYRMFRMIRESFGETP